MNHFIFLFKLFACLFALFCLTAIGHASPHPSTGHNRHICEVLDYKDMLERDSIYAATKHALNLNVGEPRTVRMIYFLPNDRPFRQEMVDSMKVAMRQIQTFYAEQMAVHGYGRKTFRFETDDRGEPVVHRLNGQHSDSHYLDNTFLTVLDEVEQAFDWEKNIYLTVIDYSIDVIGRGSSVAGEALLGGGFALVPDEFHWTTAAHEIGHTLGMHHDFRDGTYIMSYGPGENRLSMCHAEFLAVHPYFNTDSEYKDTPSPKIDLISPPTYPTGATNVTFQLKVSDPDGLHQVILFVGTESDVKACRGLSGERDAIVEFDYDGVIPSPDDPQGTGTSLSDLLIHPIYVEAVDSFGNVAQADFVLADVSTQQQYIATLTGHTNRVNSVAFSPDGTTLASGSNDRTVRLWNVATQREITTLTGHTDWVNSMAFSPDGKILASGSDDQTVRLWDVATQREITTLTGHIGWVNSVAFSPDGEILASGSNDRTVRLWNVATQREITTLTGHIGWVNSVAFSPDGKILASGSDDQTVKLWNVATQREITTLMEHLNVVSSVAFSPDGSTLASGAVSWEAVRLWDVATRTNTATLSEHTDWVNSVAFSPDGKTLASGSDDQTVKLWNVETGRNVATFFKHTGVVQSVAFSPDGSTLASGNEDGSVLLWDSSEVLLSYPTQLVKISGDGQEGVLGAALPNPLIVEVRGTYDQVLAGVQVMFTVTTGDGKLNVETTMTDATGRVESMLTLGSDPGTTIVEVTVPGLEPVIFVSAALAMADISTQHIVTFVGHTDNVNSVVFSPYGTILASGSLEGAVKLWDVETQENIATLEAYPVTSVAFSPDGTILASGSGDFSEFSPNSRSFFVPSSGNAIKLWDVETKKNIATIEVRTSPITSIAFSPDGTILASGSIKGKGIVALWDVETKKNIATIGENTSLLVTSIAFSPDGRMLASGSEDNTVVLWDVATRRSLATLEGHTVAFSPDGRMLASGSVLFGTVHLWDVETKKNIATIETSTSFFNSVNSVAFSPDGRMLASGSEDGTVKLWNVETQREITTLKGHPNWVNSVAFSPDGGTLASGDEDGLVLLWKTDLATPDFNGDERVDFSDFLLFAGQFGVSQGDQEYDARYDLDGDGVIGFSDFLIFVNAFGKKGS